MFNLSKESFIDLLIVKGYSLDESKEMAKLYFKEEDKKRRELGNMKSKIQISQNLIDEIMFYLDNLQGEKAKELLKRLEEECKNV